MIRRCLERYKDELEIQNLPEILGGPRHRISEELKFNSSNFSWSDGNVEEDHLKGEAQFSKNPVPSSSLELLRSQFQKVSPKVALLNAREGERY